MNEQLAHAVTQLPDPLPLVIAAHEVGHTLAAVAAGDRPEYVRLESGLLGGVTGGICDLGHHDPSDNAGPSDQTTDTEAAVQIRTARLVAWIAGHASHTRFCQLYLGLDTRAAHAYGRSSSNHDYDAFSYYRARYRIPLSHDAAFHRATTLLNLNTTALDWLTLRLHRARHLGASALPAGVNGGQHR